MTSLQAGLTRCSGAHDAVVADATVADVGADAACKGVHANALGLSRALQRRRDRKEEEEVFLERRGPSLPSFFLPSPLHRIWTEVALPPPSPPPLGGEGGGGRWAE